MESLSIFSFLKTSIIVSLDPKLAFLPVVDSMTIIEIPGATLNELNFLGNIKDRLKNNNILKFY